MYNSPPGDPRDPRFGQQPQGPQQPPYGQQPYGQQPQPQPQFGASPSQPQPQAYGQPPQQQAYGQPPQYGQPPPSMPPYGQPQYGAPPQPQQAPQPGLGFGMPGMGPHGFVGTGQDGGLGGLAGAGLGKAGAALPQVSGLPPIVAFGMGLVAVAIALVFDVVFLHIHIPGVGGYAWYLTTALSFAGAGYFGIKWTRATQAVAMTALGVAGAVYGLADIGLGLVLEDLTMGSSLFLGIQGLVIAVVCGGGGVRKALSERG